MCIRDRVYQYDVSMEDLKKITDGMKEEGLRSKMEDILLVMENFEDYIKDCLLYTFAICGCGGIGRRARFRF